MFCPRALSINCKHIWQHMKHIAGAVPKLENSGARNQSKFKKRNRAHNLNCIYLLKADQSTRVQSSKCRVQSARLPDGRVQSARAQSDRVPECQSARVLTRVPEYGVPECHSEEYRVPECTVQSARVLTRVPPLITSSGRILRENIAIVFFRPALEQIKVSRLRDCCQLV